MQAPARQTPVVSQPAPQELRLGFGLAPLHVWSRRYRNGCAWRLPSKTVLYHRPTAGKRCGEKKKNITASILRGLSFREQMGGRVSTNVEGNVPLLSHLLAGTVAPLQTLTGFQPIVMPCPGFWDRKGQPHRETTPSKRVEESNADRCFQLKGQGGKNNLAMT